MAVRLAPQVPLRTLAEAQHAPAGILRRQPVVRVPALFGTVPPVGYDRDFLPLPPGWQEHIHPEGIKYFVHPENRIFTHVDPQLPANVERLQLAFREIERLLPPDWKRHNVHICLGFNAMQPGPEDVQYYLVDYTFKKVFWLHTVDVLSVGLRPYPEEACLRSMLLPHFWNHVHHFPSAAWLDPEKTTRDLVGALNLARIPGYDHSTPWAQDECALLVEALEAAMIGPLPYRMSAIGRLNMILSQHRHSLRWGVNNNEPPFRPRRRVNDPVAAVLRRRDDALERFRFTWLISTLVIFFLLSAFMISEGMLILSDEVVDGVALMLTISGSFLIFLRQSTLDALQRFDPRFPAIRNDKPWLFLFLSSLLALDLAVYGMFVDSAARLIANDRLGLHYDQMGLVMLKLIVPPLLTILTLTLGYGVPLLPPT